MVRLLIPKDLPWLVPFRARWAFAADFLFTGAWVAGLFESLSYPMAYFAYSDRGVLHGLLIGVVPAIVVGWTFKTSSRTRMFGITLGSVLLWLVAARLLTRPHAFVLYG